jgi:hypothetical protein
VSIQSWAPVLKQLGRTVISPGSIKLLYTQQVEGSFEMKFDVNFASSILHPAFITFLSNIGVVP